jgi:uncharacterized protein YaeQ
LKWASPTRSDPEGLRPFGARLVYSYAATSHIWWKGLANKVERCKNLTVVDFNADATEQLGKMAQRTMQLQCTIQDGQIWLTDGATTVEVKREVLKSER